MERTGKRAIDNLTQFINEIQQSQVGQFYRERNLNYLERQQFLKLSHCHNDFLALNFLSKAKTIIWNGPVGVFEFDQFGLGTKAIATAIAESDAFSIAGGGDTLAAIDKYNVADKVSYISTGGGAFLEFVEGKVLPAVEILEQRFNEQ